jgi:hypothetical protein
MANYGASVRRAAARGGSTLTDIDIYKIFLLCKTERGSVNALGAPFVHDEIYSMNDFYKKCGGFNSSYYGSYIAQSFFDELDNNINCEMKVISPVDAAAVQASYSIMDQATSAVKIFDIKANLMIFMKFIYRKKMKST